MFSKSIHMIFMVWDSTPLVFNPENFQGPGNIWSYAGIKLWSNLQLGHHLIVTKRSRKEIKNILNKKMEKSNPNLTVRGKCDLFGSFRRRFVIPRPSKYSQNMVKVPTLWSRPSISMARNVITNQSDWSCVHHLMESWSKRSISLIKIME